jgi:hypothetical protein
VTRAPAHRQAGALLAALLTWCARRWGPDPRRLRLAVVLTLLGGGLAFCCCFDEPAPFAAADPATASVTTAAVALDGTAVEHADRVATLSADLHDAPDARPTGATARIERLVADGACDSTGVVAGAGAASGGRAPSPSAPDGVRAASTSGPLPLVVSGGARLVEHLPAQLSPYQLCVMRT